MTALLTDIGLVFTELVSYFTDVLTLYTTNNLLVLLLGIMVTGAVIGLVMRLIHRN